MNPSDASERAVMIDYLQEAADELYSQSDMPGSLLEQCFKINGDQTVAMPSYVGEIRAMREYNSHIPWNINQMRPRYNVSNWPDMWRNYRLKNRQALMRSIVNEGPVTVTCDSVETTPVTVTITGSTLVASSITEVITVDATSKQSVNNFIDIKAVIKSAITACDYVINDADGNVLTVIPNNELAAEYQIIDVSQLPWLNQNQSSQDHYVEVLYKQKLGYLQNDGDEFPAKGYDYILVMKMLQLWCEDQGKTDQAVSWDAKATRTLARKKEDQNKATQDKVAFVPHPHDSLLTKLRYGDKWRFRGYVYLQGPR